MSENGAVIEDSSQDDLDYIAMDASEGAFAATVDGRRFTVLFEGTSNDAKRSQAAYAVFGGALDAPVDDILQREGNAVVVWEDTPDDEHREYVKDCLA